MIKKHNLKFYFQGIVFLFLISNALLTKAQWTSKIPQTTDTVWIEHNHVLDVNTVWMGGHAQKWDPDYEYWDYGHAVRFYNTTDGGTNWSSGKIPYNPGSGQALLALNGIDGSKAWAAILDTDSGTNHIFSTIDKGANWTARATNIFKSDDSYINAIAFKDALNGVIIGDPAPDQGSPDSFFEIYRTTDGGNNWTRIAKNKMPASSDGEYGAFKECKRIGDKIWFSTDAGRIIYSNDGGQNWLASVCGSGYTGFLDFVDNMNGICASEDTLISTQGSLEIKYTSDGGLNWQYAKSPYKDSTYFWSLTMIPGSLYLLANNSITSEGGPFVTWLSKDKGATWLQIGQGDGLSAIKFFTPSIGYAGEGLSVGQNHGTKVFKYAGTPLSGLFTSNILNAKVSVYPNPVIEKLTIDIDFVQPCSEFVILLNSADGKLVKEQRVTNAGKSYHNEIDVKSVANGNYILTISSSEGHTTKSIIKN